MKSARIAAVFVGIAAGAGLFALDFAEADSYLGNDPAACANCHVMHDHHEAWVKSSHRAVAVCNDCHAPTALVPKYAVKALNGWNHSLAFTTGRFHEPIRITELNRRVTETQCRSCHAPLVDEIDHGGEELDCLRCHANVGHLE